MAIDGAGFDIEANSSRRAQRRVHVQIRTTPAKRTDLHELAAIGKCSVGDMLDRYVLLVQQRRAELAGIDGERVDGSREA